MDSLEEILRNWNAEGKIYISDIDKWLDYKVPIEKVRVLRDKIMELSNG